MLWTTGAVEMWITAAAHNSAKSRTYTAALEGLGLLTLSDHPRAGLTRRSVSRGNRSRPPAELAGSGWRSRFWPAGIEPGKAVLRAGQAGDQEGSTPPEPGQPGMPSGRLALMRG